MLNLSSELVIRTALDYASGNADRTGAVFDTANLEGVMIVVKLAAVAAGGANSIKAQQGAASNMSDAADLAGTAMTIADDDDNQIFILDIVKPRERYVRLVVDKDTVNACAESAIYIGYGPRTEPVTLTLADNVTYEKHVSPAEGTA